MDAQGAVTSHVGIALQGIRPGQSELSHGGMCSLWCPNVGSLASCVEHLVIAPWVSTLSGWQMTILRTCVVSMTYTSSMVSRQ